MKDIEIIISQDGYSLVKAGLLLNEKWHDGYFIIDTGSSRNIVARASSSRIAKTEEINGFMGKVSHGKEVFAYAEINGKVFPFSGLSIDRKHLPELEYKILGLIGVEFLLKNNCIIDYRKNILFQGKENLFLHTDTDRPFVRMGMGLKAYGVPVLVSVSDGHCLFFIADTGSITNIICKNESIETYNHARLTGSKSIIEGLGGSGTVASSNIEIQLLFQHRGKVITQTFNDDFGIKQSPGSILWLDSANFEIDGITGNRFLIKGKWILDFCNKILYPVQ